MSAVDKKSVKVEGEEGCPHIQTSACGIDAPMDSECQGTAAGACLWGQAVSEGD